jgi:hypothetical protein
MRRRLEASISVVVAALQAWRAVDRIASETYLCPPCRYVRMPCRRASSAPFLPTLAPQPPSGEPWPHEIKWDGFRVIGRKDGNRVRLYSRPGRRTPIQRLEAGDRLECRPAHPHAEKLPRAIRSSGRGCSITPSVAVCILRGSLLNHRLNPDFGCKSSTAAPNC